MKKWVLAVAAATFPMGPYAQVEPAVKETGKASAEGSKEAGDKQVTAPD